MTKSSHIYFLSFNCGRAFIDSTHFASHFFDALPKTSTTLPDVITVSLQEVAPLAYSFLGGSWISPYIQRVEDAVQIAARERLGREEAEDDDIYVRLMVKAVGMTVGMLFVKNDVSERVSWLQSAGVGVGVWEMGNKGACGMRICLDDQELTFVAAHLAPSEKAVLRRNKDWENIVRGLVFEDIETGYDEVPKIVNGGPDESEPLLSRANASTANGSGIYRPGTIVFFGGDLNYRTSHSSPKPDTHRTYPRLDRNTAHPSSSQLQSSSDDLERLTVELLLEKDQLTQERLAGRTLHGFTEMPIHFSPTYKYELRTSHPEIVPKPEDAAVPDDQIIKEDPWQWAKHRWPSWCDRILYIPSSALNPEAYVSLPLHASSDHRPVALSSTLHLDPLSIHHDDDDNVDVEDVLHNPPFSLYPDWRERRAAARRAEIVVGIVSYLVLMREGNAILVGLVAGGIAAFLLLRSLV